MADNVLDPIVLEVRSPVPKGLDGLNYAEQKLQGLLDRMNQINALLSKPVEVRLEFRNATAALTALRQRAMDVGKNLKGWKPVDVADLFKWDPARFEALIANAERELTRGLRRRGGGGGPARALNSNTGEFTSDKVMARAMMLMSREVSRETNLSLSEFLKRAWQPVAQQMASAAQAAPAPQSQQPKAQPASAAAPQAPAKPIGGGAPPHAGSTPFSGSSNPNQRPLTWRDVVPEDATKQIQRTRTYLNKVGEILKVYSRADQVTGQEEAVKQERVVSRVAPALAELRASMSDAQRQILEMQAGANSGPTEVAALMRRLSQKLETASKAIRAEDVGKDDEADRALVHSRRLLRDAVRLEKAAQVDAAAKDRQRAQTQIEGIKAGRAQSVARGDVGARLRLAAELESALSESSGAISPRDANRLRGQIARLRGTEDARSAMRRRSEALDAVAKADAELASSMQAGGLDAADARVRAADARRKLIQDTGAFSSLAPRQQSNIKAQEGRLRQRAEQDLEKAVQSDIVRQLDTIWTGAQTAISTTAKIDRGVGARTAAANAMKQVLGAHAADLDELELNRWTRRIVAMEGTAKEVKETMKRQGRRDAESSGRARATIRQKWIDAENRRQENLTELREFEARRRQITHSVSEAQQLIAAEQAAGARISRREVRSEGGRVAGHTVTTERETPTGLKRVSAAFTDAGASVRVFERALKATRAELGAAGRDFFRNTATVTAWSASVGALYGSLGLIRKGVTAFADVDLAMARLGAVFRGTGSEVVGLTDDVLRLAAAEGRSSSEATDSAIRWARLGYSRKQIVEAVSVSLKAANVAEISAAEATERLTGITTAYNLEARDLGDVLGMLNQVSNTWNASNAEMLTGLTRTASVARQAQIPLAELIGVLGAAIGTTGQSGANIGNAIKSLVTNLAAPELQQRLRQGFNFEVMMGEGDIAPANQILRDLFVAYQNFNREQRQSLLYWAAGRTQASRMTAILDSYVRAQVLSINAQLNLNSAERENLRIRESLHNQMQGLITEFERFTSMQGAMGPIGSALKTATETMRNAFKLGSELTSSGGGAGAWATQGMMALGGLVAARLAVTGVQMNEGKKGAQGGFIGNSLRRVSGAGVALVDTLNQATENFMASRVGIWRRIGSQTLTGRAVGGIQKVEGGLEHVGEARRRLANLGLKRLEGEMGSLARAGVAGSIAWNRALQGVAVTSRAVLMSLRASLLAVRTMFTRVFLPLAALDLAFKAFNSGMSRYGLSLDGINAKLADFEQKADAAASASRAFEQGLRLVGTVQTVIANGASSETRANMIKDLVDAEILDAETKKRISEASTAGRDDEVQAILEQQKAIMRLRAERERLAGVAANQEAKQQASQELARLKNLAQTSPDFSNTRAKNIIELEAKVAGYRERSYSILLEEKDALRERFQLDSKGRQALAALNAGPDGVKSLFESVPTSGGDAGRQAAKIAGIEASIAERQVQLAGLDAAAKVTASDLAQRDEQRKKLEKDIDLLSQQVVQESRKTKTEIVDVPGLKPRSIQVPENPGRIDYLNEEIRKKRSDIEAIGNTPTGRMEKVKALQEQLQEAIEKDREALASEMASAPYAQRREEVQVIAQATRGRIGAADVGTDEAERMLNRQREAQKIATEAEAKLSQTNSEVERANATVELLTAQSEIFNSQLDKQRVMNDLRRQERQLIIDARKEMERSLLTAGPADMVRKVAAARLGPGLSNAQFISAAPSMREELARLFPEQFNPDVAQLRRSRSKLTETSTGETLAALRSAIQNSFASLQMMKQVITGGQLQDTASAAALQLGSVAKAAISAADALKQLPEVVKQLIANSGPVRPSSGMPQAAGSTGI